MSFASFHDLDWPDDCTWTMDRRATHCYRYAPETAKDHANPADDRANPAEDRSKKAASESAQKSQSSKSIRQQVQREVEKLVADVMNTLLLFPEAAAAVRAVLYRNLHPELAEHGARQPA